MRSMSAKVVASGGRGVGDEVDVRVAVGVGGWVGVWLGVGVHSGGSSNPPASVGASVAAAVGVAAASVVSKTAPVALARSIRSNVTYNPPARTAKKRITPPATARILIRDFLSAGSSYATVSPRVSLLAEGRGGADTSPPAVRIARGSSGSTPIVLARRVRGASSSAGWGPSLEAVGGGGGGLATP